MFNIYFHGDRIIKNIALTFDDGPSQETEIILNILKDYNIKATFFIFGERIRGREKIINKIKKDGHEFGNHTFSHKKMQFKSRKVVETEIKKCDNELSKFGIKTNLFRFPSFKFGLNSLIVCWKLKKKMIFADMISKDWLNPYLKKKYNKKGDININKPINRTLSKTKNGSILNFHDYLDEIGNNKEIIQIMEKVIPKLKEKGFEFVTVSELLFKNRE